MTFALDFYPDCCLRWLFNSCSFSHIFLIIKSDIKKKCEIVTNWGWYHMLIIPFEIDDWQFDQSSIGLNIESHHKTESSDNNNLKHQLCAMCLPSTLRGVWDYRLKNDFVVTNESHVTMSIDHSCCWCERYTHEFKVNIASVIADYYYSVLPFYYVGLKKALRAAKVKRLQPRIKSQRNPLFCFIWFGFA